MARVRSFLLIAAGALALAAAGCVSEGGGGSTNPVSVTAPANGSASNIATPTFSGTAGNNAGDDAVLTVDVKQGVTTVQSLTATRSGTTWSVPASGPLADGTYTVQATQVLNPAGATTSPLVTFTVDAVAPTGIAVTTPANGTISNAASPTFSGTAGNSAGDNATLNIVVKQGVTTVQSLTATRSGTAWSVPASGPLASGTYTVEATQGDAAGNSTTSAANSFTVDTVAPAGVAVTAPADNAVVGNGTPTFSGTAGDAAGDSTTVTVNVTQGVTTLQTHSPTRSGTSWSVVASPVLAPGTYTVTAAQVDSAGNSTTSTAVTFSVPLPELVYTGTVDKTAGCFSGLLGDDVVNLTLGGDGWWGFGFAGCTAFDTETVALDDFAPNIGNAFQAPTGYECRLEIDGTSDMTPYYTTNVVPLDTWGIVFLNSSSAWPNNTTWTVRCRDELY